MTLEQVRKNPKENIRCGSSLVAWFIPITFITKFLDVIWSWVAIAVVYEIFNVVSDIKDKSRYKWIKSMFFYPGYLLQKVTTKEPTDEQLSVGLAGIKRLLEVENVQRV